MDYDGGPAFPTKYLDQGPHPGMSLRDWFAGMALIDVMMKMTTEVPPLVSLAYDIADAMTAEKQRRERRNNDTDRNNPFD